MKNVRDTSDFLRVRRQPDNFNMKLVISDWPGPPTCSRAPDSNGRVPWHPHGNARPSENIRETYACLNSKGHMPLLERVASEAVGLAEARRMFAGAQSFAVELQVELDIEQGKMVVDQ